MKKLIGGFAAGVVAVMAMVAVAEDRKPVDPGKPGAAPVPVEVTLEGEVIDLTSYLKDGSKGKDHWKQAKAYVQSGTPAALLTFDGKLYVVTPYNGEGFEPLKNVGEIIRLRGIVYERDGVKCVIAKDKETKKLPPGYKPGDGGGDAGHDAGGAKMGGGVKPGGK